MSVAGKHIVITGGTSGIGLELIKQLHAGNHIFVIARPSSRLNLLRNDFDNITVVEADLSDLKAVEKAGDMIAKSNECIDVLINNAAVQYTPHFLDDDFRLETIKREVDINFTSACTLIYLLLPSLLKSTSSIILNVNSGLALAPKTNSAVYCATKGALNVFSKSLQYQLEDTNISVKQVFLPLVDTGMTQGRGSGKLTAEYAASEIIKGLFVPGASYDVGKVKILRALMRLSPALASKIMKGA